MAKTRRAILGRHGFGVLGPAALTFVVLAVAAPSALAQGCAMCGTAVSSPKDPLARGLFLSILLMLAVPNLLIASIGGWLFYVYRQASRQQARLLSLDAGLGDDASAAAVLIASTPESGLAVDDSTRRFETPDKPSTLGERT